MGFSQRLREAAMAATKSNLELLDVAHTEGRCDYDSAERYKAKKIHDQEYREYAEKHGCPQKSERKAKIAMGVVGTIAGVSIETFMSVDFTNNLFMKLGVAIAQNSTVDIATFAAAAIAATGALYYLIGAPLMKQAAEQRSMLPHQKADMDPDGKILTLDSWVIGAKNLVVAGACALSKTLGETIRNLDKTLLDTSRIGFTPFLPTDRRFGVGFQHS